MTDVIMADSLEELLEDRSDAQSGHSDRGVRNRWQMNRAGILNFWFYEDEEFELEEGRLVLRGTNGAGKSVTMQSFIPLVLDGDKHPNRLDPFGSRDRRIEYYLLGDKEEHTDRTGYLWLEFYHPAKNIYKTIGIGLRARRGAAQIGFWGFVLEDGRRINHDFWLYDHVLAAEGQGKYPLDRRSLEERIGAGGQVVQEQRAYRNLVNRALFGFHDIDAYVDLLNLLIQLRSPKLSKDVKPTAIYDILVRALPPLHEEELRPLSEVMEDMDQLTDRLDELKLHRVELEKLNRSYEQYNRYLLYQSGEQLLAAYAEHSDISGQMSVLSEELQSAVKEKQEVDLAKDINQEETLAAETELELLDRSEALEKQVELERTEQSLEDTRKYLDQTQKRLTAALRHSQEAELKAEEAKELRASLLEQQQNELEELDGLAGDMEFADHGVYARYWDGEPPEDTVFLSAWQRDVKEHRRQVSEAIRLAEQERDARQLVAEYDRQLGEMRAERDLAEEALRNCERAAESALYEWKERLLSWKQSLVRLQMEDQAVQEMFSASNELSFEQQNMDAVLEVVRSAADRIREQLVAARLDVEQLVKQKQAERETLVAEKQEWEQKREPEPPRSASRVETRQRYRDRKGAPLYEVCEFQPHIWPEKQAVVERTLLTSGLLDAWIHPDGRIVATSEQDEETWIVPRPIEWGYTLADVLKPAPSEESGLSVQQVETVLRSFAWGETFDVDTTSASQDSSSVVIGNDYFQFGALVGKLAHETHQAQYIGKEARKKFKQAEIARLSEEIARCDQQLEELQSQIRQLEMAVQQLQDELANFPIQDETSAALRKAWAAQAEASMRFRLLMERENKLADKLRQQQQVWTELKQSLIALTSKWSRLKSLRDLQEAYEAISNYMAVMSQLVSNWREYRQRDEEARRYEQIAQEQAELAETEEQQRDELLDKQYELRLKTEKLRELMNELGISTIYERIRTLKDRKQELTSEWKELIARSEEIAAQIAALRERQTGLAERFRAADDILAKRKRYFIAEWRLRLVPETEDHDLQENDMKQLIATCRSVTDKLEPIVGRSNKERLSGVLQDHYNASKHLLAEYILEAGISDTGRITLLSMRDRNHPQKPGALLAEIDDMILEQENLLSEKDRELFEEIILRSVGKAIRERIGRAELWLKTMNKLMAERDTSSGLKLQLQWLPKAAQSESELNSDELVALLRRDAHLLHDDEVEKLIAHFRSRVQWAKQNASEEREALRKHIYEMLDYRSWFQFTLRYKKGDDAQYRELTDSRFNVLSGGEKAMSMYIPLFAATYSRYADASPDAPKIISLDEAFAGVDDENIRDLFALLTEMDFDYMMTSQVLWGCYDTVPKLSICEICRPKDANYVTVLRYKWNGKHLEPVASVESEEKEVDW